MFDKMISFQRRYAVLIAALPFPSAAQAAPLDYFLHSHGPATRPVMLLGWIFTAICVAVFIIVASLLAIAIMRRRPAANERDIHHGGGGLRWVYIGTAISTVILFAMGVYALVALNDAANPPHPPGLTITVTGYQWWWEAVYDDANPARRFATANEIHIPTGVPVLLILKSADVIHAFWVPQLAGKTQMIPGLINRQWLQADAPGVYRGQCTQYCGIQHAHMAFEIVAQNEKDFETWREAQRRSVMPVPAADTGARIFKASCASCHTIRGIGAAGTHGPDLTHLQSRREIAAGLLTNTPEHLADWIARAQELKPGVRMPDFDLSARDRRALIFYLSTLK
jgi:cytochrome c oxidase subunit II